MPKTLVVSTVSSWEVGAAGFPLSSKNPVCNAFKMTVPLRGLGRLPQSIISVHETHLTVLANKPVYVVCIF